MDTEKPVIKQDPTAPEMVCRRTLTADPAYVPSTVYQGRRLYFCTDFCLNAFLADPERFYPAHNRKRSAPETCEYNNLEKP